MNHPKGCGNGNRRLTTVLLTKSRTDSNFGGDGPHGSNVQLAAADGMHASAVDGCGAATCPDVWHASVGAPVTTPVAVAGAWLDADGRLHACTTS
jgi:hypothetical protein